MIGVPAALGLLAGAGLAFLVWLASLPLRDVSIVDTAWSFLVWLPAAVTAAGSTESGPRTAEAWLDNMETHRAEVWPILARTYGAERAGLWWMRWRLFFLSCAELFGHDQGREWWVAHYLFEPRR